LLNRETSKSKKKLILIFISIKVKVANPVQRVRALAGRTKAPPVHEN